MSGPSDNYAISLASIHAAAERIEGLAHRTPVVTCSAMDEIASSNSAGVRVRVFFKCENMQKIGAFKIRGATNAVKKALETREPGAGPLTFVTHSSGNHAQAVALAARNAGCKAIIVMPDNAPIVKQNAVRGYGAQIVYSAADSLSRETVAAEWVQRTGGVFIHPSDDVEVMSGQGTAALELLDQVFQQWGVSLDAVVAPIGGGGLSSGTGMAVKSTDPKVKMYAVEPSGAPDAYASFISKKLQGHSSPPNTIADGLRTTLGENNFPVIRDHVDEIILVSDDEIVSTMKLMWERMKSVVEPSGAVAAAGVVTHKLPLANLVTSDKNAVNIGVIISGGNVDLDELPWIKKSEP